MSRAHDMGGRHGDGPVQPEPQGIVPFATQWHRKALALVIAAGATGAWNIDMSRHARECLAPADYARLSPTQLAAKMAELEQRMYRHARDLEFEDAARVRDEIRKLKEASLD